jgi:hypothetical protein
MSFNLYISELNGYLKSLQRLSGNKCVFGATSFQCNFDEISDVAQVYISNLSEKDNFHYHGKVNIQYRELMKKIKSIVFSGILSKEQLASDNIIAYLESVITEDINEYYGLASNPNESFHPLIEDPVYLLDIKDDSVSESLYFIVQVGGRYVLAYFCKRK